MNINPRTMASIITFINFIITNEQYNLPELKNYFDVLFQVSFDLKYKCKILN